VRRYLIVDDNRPFAENLAEIVRDLGVDVEVAIAESGAEALELAQQLRFDCVISDMRMPFMGGAEVVHRIRLIDPGIPAIVVTAHVGDDDLAAARREGLLAVLPKPVPVDRLVELLGVARRDGLAVIVEDDADLSDNMTEALRSRGFGAVAACSVLETERLGPVRPFVGLVDLHVPGGSHGEAMRRLAQKYPGLAMLVVTGFHEPPPVPYEALFSKPFDTPQLLAAVERLHARHLAALTR
jgi:CheY-like chemotaxis protein